MKRIMVFITVIGLLTGIYSEKSPTATADAGNENISDHTYCSHEFCDGDADSINVDEEIEGLSIEELKENEYLERCKSNEDNLNTLVFKGIDGNMRKYIYQYPVKYKNKDGNIEDIDLTIEKSRDANNVYISDKNSFTVTYGNKGHNFLPNIVSQKDDYRVELTAVSDEKVNEIEALSTTDDNEIVAVKYNDVFEDGINIVYNPTYTGYKESIVIEQLTDLSEYAFELNCGNLEPVLEDNGEITFWDYTQKEMIGSFSPIVMFDSAEETHFSLDSYYSLERTDSAGIYNVVIHADKAFLDSKDIVYPITIDPTLHYKGGAYIEDATVYSGSPNSHDNSILGYVGYKNSTYGIAYTLVNFTGLDNAFINSIDEDELNYIRFGYYNAYGSEDITSAIAAYRFNGPAWTESTVTYNSVNAGSNIGTLIQSKNIKKNKFYEYDITSTVLAWKNSSTNGFAKGLILKNNTSSNDASYQKGFATIQFGNTISNSCMPYVYLNYNLEGSAGPFASANDAARAFAENVYVATYFSMIEYGATIYEKNGGYYYCNVHHGAPHSTNRITSVPSGATIVSYIHTHIYGIFPSSQDMANVTTTWNYVVTPDFRVARYNNTSYSYIADSTGNFTFNMSELNASEKLSLAASLASVWNGHWNDVNVYNAFCSGYHCSDLSWPRSY